MTSMASNFLDESIYTLMSSAILFLVSVLCARITRSLISPAFVFSFVWAVALFVLSFTPFFGFYSVTSNALLIFIFGAIIFSTTSLIFNDFLVNLKFKNNNQLAFINFKGLLVAFNLLSILILPAVITNILGFGSNLIEIAYNIRYAAVHGESVVSTYSANYFVFCLFTSVLFVYAVVNKHLNFLVVAISLVPFLITILILNGRSGLISLILSWFFVYVFSGGKINTRSLMVFFLVGISIIFFGATLVNKVDVEDSTFFNTLIILIEHIMDYLLQGPVLFSRYFDNEISINENWDTLNIACYIISKIDACVPLAQHQDIAKYGANKVGNVYTFYFSLLPHNSYIGSIFFIMLYSIITTYFYKKAKSGHVFSLVISGYLFGVMILTIFKDGFGYSLILFIKFYLLSFVLVYFFTKKTKTNM